MFWGGMLPDPPKGSCLWCLQNYCQCHFILLALSLESGSAIFVHDQYPTSCHGNIKSHEQWNVIPNCCKLNFKKSHENYECFKSRCGHFVPPPPLPPPPPPSPQKNNRLYWVNLLQNTINWTIYQSERNILMVLTIWMTNFAINYKNVLYFGSYCS